MSPDRHQEAPQPRQQATLCPQTPPMAPQGTPPPRAPPTVRLSATAQINSASATTAALCGRRLLLAPLARTEVFRGARLMFAVTPMALSRCALLEGGSLAQVEGSVTRTVVLFLIFFWALLRIAKGVLILWVECISRWSLESRYFVRAFQLFFTAE